MMRDAPTSSDGARAIGTPPPQREEVLRLPDPHGEWLHLEHFAPPAAVAPRLVVVFTHGFSPYATPYRHVAQALVEAGHAVTLYDVRGHGHSTGRRGHVEAFDDYTADLERVVARARAPFPGVPFALIGHSQGGAIVLDYLLPARSAPARVMPFCAVVAAPMLAITVPIPWYKLVTNLLFGPLFRRLPIGNGITGPMITRNEEIQRAFARDPLVHHVATSRWFGEAAKMQARVRASAAQLTVPILLLTAGADLIVSPAAQDELARAAPPGLLEQRTYPSLFHELFLEPERDRVIDDMTTWMAGKLDQATGRSR
jgi:alpha-beta hydrolase superfamily lysophospholipase